MYGYVSAKKLLRLRRAEREALLQRVTALLRADERIHAAWLAGSLGRGEADDLSDIDLWLAVADEHCPAMVAGRRAYVARLSRPLLIEEAPQNAPCGGAYLLVLYGGQAGPQQVDWYWQPQGTAAIPHDARVLFDRVGLPREALPVPPLVEERTVQVTEQIAFFWAMLNIAARYIARGWPAAALQMIGMASGALAAVREFASELPGNCAEAWAARSPEHPQARQMALLRALAGEMEALMPRVVALGASAPADVVPQIYRFFDLVQAVAEGEVAAHAAVL